MTKEVSKMRLPNSTLGFIGTGNMGEALINGLLKDQVCEPGQIICSDVRADRRESIAQTYGVRVTPDNAEVIGAAGIVILAIKPQILIGELTSLAPFFRPEQTIISIAAGVPLDLIANSLGGEHKLVRVMPNICSSVREGASAVAIGKGLTKEDLKAVDIIFSSVGKTIFIEEYLLDAVTGLSGSGPAYIFLIIDALADAGVKVGLSRRDSLVLAAQTVLGAAKMLIETGEHPGKLKDMVTSPGGTAIAGLHTLEEGGLRTTLMNAVEAATRRSQALGEVFRKNNGGQ
jgi:pyrroline-5-carboxylate reductase